MKTLPPIGAKVVYMPPATHSFWEGPMTGTVVAHYPSDGELHRNEETGECWVSPDYIGMRVDKLPPFWPYNGTDRFAPEVADIELYREGTDHA
jgi:hypothetical protein